MNKEAFRRIWSKILWIYHKSDGSRWILTLYIAIGVLQSILGVGYALVFKHMVDIVTGEMSGSVYQMVLLVALIMFGQEIFSASQSVLIVRTRQKMTNQLKEEMFNSVLHSCWTEIERFHSGDIVNRLENDATTIITCLTDTIPQMINSSFRLVFAFGTMLYLDWVIAVVSVIILPLILLIAKYVLKQLHKLNKELRKISSESTSYIQETIQHSMVIKAFQIEQEKKKGLSDIYNNMLKVVIKRNFLGILSGTTISMGFSLGYLFAFVTGAFRMEAGLISFGTVTAFLQLVSQVQNPLYNLANIVPSLVSISIAAERLMELNNLEKEKYEVKEPLKAPVCIRFSNVTFSYGRKDPVLKEICCTLESGKATAIIGKTGEGKTTFLKLLLAFLTPEQGAIYLETKGCAVVNGISYRNTYTYVPQGNTLFSGTVRQNLLLGNACEDENALKKALHCACAEFLYELPNGLDTLLGEKGAGLSEGQALRVSIVRGLLRTAPIMIFDESTSALDELTQIRVFTRIKEGYKDKTMIFVTHKLSLAWKCDQIIRIENQKIHPVKKQELEQEIERIEQEELKNNIY